MIRLPILILMLLMMPTVGWYGTGVLNILAGGNASLTTITTSVIGGNENSKGTVNVLGGTGDCMIAEIMQGL